MKVDVLLSLPIMRALGWALFYSLWQGTLLTILLVSALKLLPSNVANVRYTLSCVVLLLMVLLPVATALNVEVWQHQTASAEFASANTTSTPGTDRSAIETSGIQTWRHQLKRQIEPLLSWLILAWSIGVSVLSVRLLGGWVQVQQLSRRERRPVSNILQAKTKELAQRLRVRVPVRILESTYVRVPAVVGRLRPVILLPASVLTGLSAQQLEAIIVHELAHIRRHDYLVNLLQTVVETLLFYHPAAWWVSRQIRIEREHACDDLAVSVCGDRLKYARALTSVERLRKVTAPELTMAVNGGELLSRIRRLVEPPSRHSYQFGIIAASTFLIGIVSLGAMTHTLSLTSTAHTAGDAIFNERALTIPSEPLPTRDTTVETMRFADGLTSSARKAPVTTLEKTENRASLELATEPKRDTPTESGDNAQKESHSTQAQTPVAANNEAAGQPNDSLMEDVQSGNREVRARAMKELRRRARQDAIQGINDSVMETSRQVNLQAEKIMKQAIQNAVQAPESKSRP